MPPTMVYYMVSFIPETIIYEGYWQRNGWTNDAREATHSFIAIPGQAPIRDRFRNLDLMNMNIVPGQKLPIAGVAFAGDRGISKVEVKKTAVPLGNQLA
jgi:hypothetical protein